MTEYPEQLEIWADCIPQSGNPRKVALDCLRAAYNVGRSRTDTLDGWANLTQAIQDGERIDWEELDGMPAKCVHPDMGMLTYKLERDKRSDISSPYGWGTGRIGYLWSEVLINAWDGLEGWSLYIKGEIPIKRKTADQLEPGMCLRSDDGVIGIVFEDIEGKKAFWGANRKIQPAAEIIVAQEYGIGSFQKKEEK